MWITAQLGSFLKGFELLLGQTPRQNIHAVNQTRRSLTHLGLIDPNRETPEDVARSRMAAYAESFPRLGGARGVSPWEAMELDRWAAGLASHGEPVTARNVVLSECALRDVGKPVGVSSYVTKLGESLPARPKGSFPSPEDLEAELRRGRHEDEASDQ